MVTVWIGGGLGNQMFMCAYAFVSCMKIGLYSKSVTAIML